MFVIPIGASSKLIQLRTIIANKSAGQVTRTGWIIAAYGSAGKHSLLSMVSLWALTDLARIVTNLYLTQDMKIMANLSIGLILNVAVAIACTIYPQKAVSASAENTKEKTT